MAAKLSSILRQIPWSLVLKAGIFGLSWLILPFWIFLLVGVYFYFFPLFQPGELVLPLCLTFVLAAVLSPNVLFALFLGTLFFLILGIKNLILVNRFASRQLVAFLLLFLVFLSFFSQFENWQAWPISFWWLGIVLVVFCLIKESADYRPEPPRRQKFLVAGLGSLFIWQIGLVALFLPLNYFYQTALLFLSAVFLIDVLLDYLNSRLHRRKILTNFSIFLVLLGIIMASAKWVF